MLHLKWLRSYLTIDVMYALCYRLIYYMRTRIRAVSVPGTHYFVLTCGRKCLGAPTALPCSYVQNSVLLDSASLGTMENVRTRNFDITVSYHSRNSTAVFLLAVNITLIRYIRHSLRNVSVLNVGQLGGVKNIIYKYLHTMREVLFTCRTCGIKWPPIYWKSFNTVSGCYTNRATPLYLYLKHVSPAISHCTD